MPVSLVPRLHSSFSTYRTKHKEAVGGANEQRLNLSLMIRCKLDLKIIDLAEFVLNRCITSKMQGGQTVHYNFEYLERLQQRSAHNPDEHNVEKTGQRGRQNPPNQGAHILYWMVSH